LQLGGEVCLPVHAGWSELLLFSPGGSCVALQLQFGHLLPRQGREMQFWIPPSVPETSSGIHHQPHCGRLAYYPNLCASPDLCLMLTAPLRGWLLSPSQLSAFVAFPTFVHSLRVQLLAPLHLLLSVLDCSLLFLLFSFVGGVFSGRSHFAEAWNLDKPFSQGSFLHTSMCSSWDTDGFCTKDSYFSRKSYFYPSTFLDSSEKTYLWVWGKV
jgi:hypothetical protein